MTSHYYHNLINACSPSKTRSRSIRDLFTVACKCSRLVYFIYLFVCVQDYAKSYEGIWMKFGGYVGHGLRKTSLDFESIRRKQTSAMAIKWYLFCTILLRSRCFLALWTALVTVHLLHRVLRCTSNGSGATGERLTIFWYKPLLFWPLVNRCYRYAVALEP